MRFSLSITTLAFLYAAKVSLAHDLNPVVQCIEYNNNLPPDGVKWHDHIELTQILNTQTSDELDWIRGRPVDITPDRDILSWQDLRASHRRKSYYLTVASKSIPNNTTLKAELITDKGAGQQWKFNFIDVDDQIIKSYWLNTLDTCTIPSSWYLQDVKAFTVQPRDQPN